MGFVIPFEKQLEAAGLPAPEREFKFWKGRNFAFDYAWPEQLLALEKEGGLYGRGKPCPVCHRKAPGAHSSIQRLLSDREKYNKANWRGWMLIRALPEEFENGRAVNMVEFSLLTIKLRSLASRSAATDAIKRWKELKHRIEKAG